MRVALEEAQKSGCLGEVPVGAAIADGDGKLIASAGNRTRQLKDPTAHAEILAIRIACEKHGSERLLGCCIYVTLEPCPMCAAAIAAARLARLYYGASDPKSGGIEIGPRIFSHMQCHHRPEVYGGIGESESEAMLAGFFTGIRECGGLG
ncbi:MAG: nucleoside deaminase [Albidovulum sp.]|nr:nucleoside deaminase [Albidovulum sp.]